MEENYFELAQILLIPFKKCVPRKCALTVINGDADPRNKILSRAGLRRYLKFENNVLYPFEYKIKSATYETAKINLKPVSA